MESNLIGTTTWLRRLFEVSALGISLAGTSEEMATMGFEVQVETNALIPRLPICC